MVTRIVQGWKELDTNAVVSGGDVDITGGQLRTFGEAITAYAVGSARTGPERNGRFYFVHPYTIEAGDVVDVKVEHFHTGDTLNFESTIYGFKYVAP